MGHCLTTLPSLRDALEVVSGKWKLLILVALATGHQRFRDIERSIPGISSKVLAKELKDLEQHQLIRRTVQEGPPVLVTYEVVCSKYPDAEVGTAVRMFLKSTISSGQFGLDEYGYVPIPDAFNSTPTTTTGRLPGRSASWPHSAP